MDKVRRKNYEKFEDHLNKCRCCFTSFNSEDIAIKISKKFEQIFANLQLQVFFIFYFLQSFLHFVIRS